MEPYLYFEIAERALMKNRPSTFQKLNDNWQYQSYCSGVWQIQIWTMEQRKPNLNDTKLTNDENRETSNAAATVPRLSASSF